MSENSITRVHYFERQFLRTQDFTDEQAYHIAMRRRHNLAHHTWGIVRGLHLRYDELEKVFILDAGFAVDGYGREVVLAEPRGIALRIFDDRATEALDVYLEYCLEGTDKQPVNRCEQQEDSAGLSFYRWRESARLVFETADLEATDHRKPRAVPEGDLDFDATRTPPDADHRRWPIFVGRIQRQQDDTVPYKVELGGRPYAGVVAGEIRRADDQVRVVLGADDDPQFAVYMPEAFAENTAAFEILENGTIHLRGVTTVYGDIRVQGGTWQFDKVASTSTAAARPWQIYVTDAKAEADQAAAPQASASVTEMRIEIEAGQPPTEHAPNPSLETRFAVGVWSDEKKTFLPIIQVSEGGDVTISGNLIANSFQKASETPGLTDDARREINNLIRSGVPNETLLSVIQNLLSRIFSG